MNQIFGIGIPTAQIVLELNLSESEQKKIANKIIRGKSVTSLQHFIAAGEDQQGAVIISDGQNEKYFLGDWKFKKTVDHKYHYENYFDFTPICEINGVNIITVDEFTGERYLFFTLKNYKKL